MQLIPTAEHVQVAGLGCMPGMSLRSESTALSLLPRIAEVLPHSGGVFESITTGALCGQL